MTATIFQKAIQKHEKYNNSKRNTCTRKMDCYSLKTSNTFSGKCQEFCFFSEVQFSSKESAARFKTVDLNNFILTRFQLILPVTVAK